MRVALVLLLLCATSASAADTVVVCPDTFREALQPWLEHRAKQDHAFRVISPGSSAEETQDHIRRIARSDALRYVVLVGDAVPDRADAAADKQRCVPTTRVPAKAIRKLGRDVDIATDNGYADLDSDGLPDLAVGRLTADSPEQLRTIVRKILDHERPERFDDWCRRVHFVAGVGGFGILADAALETCAKHFITNGIPAAYGTTMTQASWSSPYCPDPRQFHQTTVDRLNQGGLFWVYIGHGHRRGLDALHVPGNRAFPIFAARDVAKLKCRRGAPLALFLACYTGAFDQPDDCLAEELLRHDGGPVAVLAGSRTTMPYAMGVMALEMMRECFVHRRETIGEIALRAKRNLVLRPRKDQQSKTLDWLASTLSINDDLAAERREHVLLFNLLGDPLLRMPRWQPVELQVPESAKAGKPLEIVGHCKIDGRCTVELVVRRDRLTFAPPIRSRFSLSDTAAEEYRQTYGRANDPRLAAVELPVQGGRFSTTLTVPPTAKGPCHIRVFLQGREGIAMGAADVKVKPPAKTVSE